MYSPNIGFKPRTRLELVEQAYEKWVQLTGTSDTFNQFQATNVHLLLNLFFDDIQSLETQIANYNIEIFEYWKDNAMSINNSLGASYEGWQAVFKPLCTGLDIATTTENSTLKSGEITIYFDNLTGSQEQVIDGFLKCKNIAEPTIGGDNTILITYSNGQTRTYSYFNLLPENYTRIDVTIGVKYKYKGENAPESMFETAFKENFKNVNRINMPFYPESYMDYTPYPYVQQFVIKSKLATDATFVSGVRPIDLGNKYILGNVNVEVIS